MAITVVGSTIAGVALQEGVLYSSPQLVLTLPAGALSTDWMAVFVSGGTNASGTLFGESAGTEQTAGTGGGDLRLSTVNGGYVTGAFNRMSLTGFGRVDDARTLKIAHRNSDPGSIPPADSIMIAAVVVLRGVAGFVSPFTPPTNDYTVADDIIGDTGVVIAAVADYATGTAAVGTSGDWTEITDYSVASTASDTDQIDFSGHLRVFLAPDPVTTLSVTSDPTTVFRARSWPLHVPPAAAAPGLRVRHTIPPERVRGRIPPERVRQVIP